MKEIESKKKLLMFDTITLSFLDLIIFIMALAEDTFNYLKIGISLVSIIIFLIICFLANTRNKKAGILGIIVGIIMMLSIVFGKFVVCILGLLLTLHSAKYFNTINENKEKINTI